MKLPFKLPVGKIIRGFVIADFVRKHGRPPLSAAEIDEHHDVWMLANGDAVAKWARVTLRNLPTSLGQMLKSKK